jgi:D-aspartate ligase
LIPCGDVYSEILSETQDDVRATFGEDFTFTIIPFEMLQKLINKSSFYKVAEEVGLPYPKTKEFVADNQADSLPFDFPVALKPANSTQWLKIDFEGKKKAFIIEEEAELRDVLKKTYEAGYTDIMICQEFVRGDDSQMRVVNGYVDRDHNVRLLSLGNPLLEDPSPIAVGNYMAILPVFDQEIYSAVENFIKKIGYVGFINMDLKIDAVTGKPYFFEVNIRQGRSSYFVTANGANLAEYYVRDMVNHEPFTETVYTDTHVAWLGLPKSLVMKYASNNDTEKKLLELVRQGKYANTVAYPKDMSFMRRLLLMRMNQVYKKNYATYFVDKTQL